MAGIWGFIVTLVQLLGILHAMHAVFHVRTAQAAVAWVVGLVTLPWIALPMYWVFGRTRFATGYIKSRRVGQLHIHELARKAVAQARAHRADAVADNCELCRSAEFLADLPCTGSNRVELLINGGAAFSVMLEDIAHATRYVIVQFFIVEEGQLSGEFMRVLAEKAREGVSVYFLYDEMGCSRKLRRRTVRKLKAAGVDVSSFRPTRGIGNKFQLNFRNHRKVTIIDGRRAYVGGLNLGDRYIGRSARFGPWRDTHVKIEGPAVQCVQLAFLEDWRWATKKVLELDWTPATGGREGVPALVLPTGPADRLETLQLFVLHAIETARTRCWIASPYFVPGPEIAAALQLAVVRGVDVRIMLPQRADHLLVYLASFSFYQQMLASGVKLYRYQPGFMHQKVMLIDDDIATVGTANLDNRSFHLNFEITLLVRDERFAAKVGSMLEDDFAQCRLAELSDYQQRPISFRAGVRLARLLAPIL